MLIHWCQQERWTMNDESFPSSDVYAACQKHIDVLRRHNQWLSDELEKQRKKNEDRQMNIFMFMSWLIAEDDGIVFISYSGDQLQINRKNINYLLVPCSQTKCN